MVPESLIRYSTRDGIVILHFLTERDHPWIRLLIEEYEGFIDRPRRELDERFEVRLPPGVPLDRSPIIRHLLDRIYRGQNHSKIPPVQARQEVFRAHARDREPADVILQRVGKELGVTPEELDESLFADIPRNRRIAQPQDPVGPAELALRANHACVQGVLYRSSRVEIEVEGQARPLVRLAKLCGLMCTVESKAHGRRAVLHVSGPYSLFKRTLLYGRALCNLVPALAWCERFRLESRCTLRNRELGFSVSSGDPILPGREPRRFDSKLEERFDRDFRKVAPEYDIIREPEPVSAGQSLIFPDFALQHRRDPSRRWILEIVGFWTPDYLGKKLACLRMANLDRFILCLDMDRNCSRDELPEKAHVVPFRRKIDPLAVLKIMGRDLL